VEMGGDENTSLVARISGYAVANLEEVELKFIFSSAPNPAGEAYSAPSDPLAGLRCPTSKGKGRGGEGKEKRGMRKGGKEG